MSCTPEHKPDARDLRVLAWVARETDGAHGALAARCPIEGAAGRWASLVGAGLLVALRWFHRAPVPPGLPAEGVWYFLTDAGRVLLDAAPVVSKRGAELLALLDARGFVVLDACTVGQRDALWRLVRQGLVRVEEVHIYGVETSIARKVAS